MPTLTLLAHVSSEHHTHWEGISFIVIGAVLGAVCLYFRKTA